MTDTVSRVRLDEDELARLRGRLPRPVVTADTTAHQAGYQLGIQHVLELLRDGWTISKSK